MLETSAQYLEDRTKTTQNWPSINYIQPIMQLITVWLGFDGRPKNHGFIFRYPARYFYLLDSVPDRLMRPCCTPLKGIRVFFRLGQSGCGLKLKTRLYTVHELKNEWSYKSTVRVWHHGVHEDIYWPRNVAKTSLGSA